MKNFKKSTGKILLASGLVVSMSACSVTNLFGEKEKQMLNLVNKKVKKLRQKVNHLKQRKNQLTQKEESKDVKMIMVLPEDYPQLMVDIEEDLLRRLDYYDASVRDNKKGSKSNEEVRDSIKDLDKVFNKIERIDAPGKYKEDHKEIVKAVQKLKRIFQRSIEVI